MPKLHALVLAALVSLSPAVAQDTQETRYAFLFAGNPAGEGVSRVEADGTRVYTFEFNDRGRGPKTSTRMRLDDKGLPVLVETTGHDYWKSPVEERFERKEGRLVWKNASENENRPAPSGPAFYLSLNGPPQETELLARALLAAPGNRLAVLPTGEARIEKVSSAKVQAEGKGSRTVDLYSISGLGFTPGYIWLDEQKNLFASGGGWAILCVDGWQSTVPELTKIQDAVVGQRLKDLAGKLARRPKGALVFKNARLFDPETETVRPGTTVVISGNRIQAVGQDGEVAGAGRGRGDRRRGQDAAARPLGHAHPPRGRRRPAAPGGRRHHRARPRQRHRQAPRPEAPVGRRRDRGTAGAHGRLHRRPRPLRRPHQGAGGHRGRGPRGRGQLREARLRADQALQLARPEAGAGDHRAGAREGPARLAATSPTA